MCTNVIKWLSNSINLCRRFLQLQSRRPVNLEELRGCPSLYLPQTQVAEHVNGCHDGFFQRSYLISEQTWEVGWAESRFLSQFARGWFHNELISLSRATGLPYPMCELIDAANPQKQHWWIWHANSVNHEIETKPHGQLILFTRRKFQTAGLSTRKKMKPQRKLAALKSVYLNIWMVLYHPVCSRFFSRK